MYACIFHFDVLGNLLIRYYEKVELHRLTVCLVCGSYQCPYCPHYAKSHMTTPNVVITVFLLLTSIYNTLLS